MILNYFANRKQKKQIIQEAIMLKKQLDEAAAKESLDKKIIMESDVPWYKLIGDAYDILNPPNIPISERYEWNKAFIKHLRNDGFKGETDAELISNWEHKLEQDRIDKLNALSVEEKKKSNDPWVEVIGEDYDEFNKQVNIKLDWNSAFIKMLRHNGYSGNDDSEVVNRWFKDVSESIAKDLHSGKFDG